jgi:phosphatidylglycerol---prolipoprotein diacylglyceryl transferase
MSFFELSDRLTIPSLLGAGFIRIGNFFNSEIIGLPTNMPWAVIFLRIDNVPRHPAMLYEAGAYLLVFCVLYLAYWKTRIARFPGRITGVSLVVCFIARFMIEFVKEDQVPFEQGLFLNMGQLLSIPFVAAGIFLIYLSSKAHPSQGPIASRKPAGKLSRKRDT